jgi:hypothetical protein
MLCTLTAVRATPDFVHLPIFVSLAHCSMCGKYRIDRLEQLAIGSTGNNSLVKRRYIRDYGDHFFWIIDIKFGIEHLPLFVRSHLQRTFEFLMRDGTRRHRTSA